MFESSSQPIKIYNQIPRGSEDWLCNESQNSNNSVNTLVAYNITEPTLTAYLPTSETVDAPAVIICPGGGFHFLAIDHEGNVLAEWLSRNGIAAFVLKYRTVPVSTDNPFDMLMSTRTAAEWDKDAEPFIPFAVEDGRQAIRFLHVHAKEYNIDSSNIGIVGFSAGAMVAIGTSFQGDEMSKPKFIASIYGDLRNEFFRNVTNSVPALFLVCAQDDDFGFISPTLELYNKWYSAGRPVEMHLFNKGGHGFGVGIPNHPTGNWPNLFLQWMRTS